MMKLMPPWRYSVTFLWRCRAIGLKAHALEQRPMAFQVRRGVFDELEAVGAHGPADLAPNIASKTRCMRICRAAKCLRMIPLDKLDRAILRSLQGSTPRHATTRIAER